MIRHNAGAKIMAIPGDAVRVTHPASAAVIPWYLSGGISAANCIAAYQPKGAADYAASKVNLANPGTYNAADGAAYPTWDATSGWIFNGSNQFLNTGWTPGVYPQTLSALMRFSNWSGTVGRWAFGVITGTTYFGIQPKDDQASPNVAYLSGSFLRVNPYLTSGNLAIAGAYGYRNGNIDSSAITSSSVNLSSAVVIGGVNSGTPATAFCALYIQAIAFYNAVLTAPQVFAIHTAMAAI